MRSKHTEEQLAWLKNHLPKYEQKTSGATRGDAKKFALDCAQTYIQLWGLPKNANGEEEKESVVKEQIYTWFKNSCARGKDARLKHQQKKNAQQHTHVYAQQHTPPQHVPYAHHNPPPPPRSYVHPSLLSDDDARRRRFEGYTLPPLYSAPRRPPSPHSAGSSSSAGDRSPALAPLRPVIYPAQHPHHLPPTSSLRSSQNSPASRPLSITTAAPPSKHDPSHNPITELLRGERDDTSDVAIDALQLIPRALVDILFSAAAALVSSSPSSSSSGASSKPPMLPTPISVAASSPSPAADRMAVDSIRHIDDDDADADADADDDPSVGGVPFSVTSPSPAPSRRSRSPTAASSTTAAGPGPGLDGMIRAFHSLLGHLEPRTSRPAHALLCARLRKVPPIDAMASGNLSAAGGLRERAESAKRQRAAHVLWARLLGAFVAHNADDAGWRWFARGCVQDALDDDDADEACWLAGAHILRALVASSPSTGDWERNMCDSCEQRWREVRDERRQGEMGELVDWIRSALS